MATAKESLFNEESLAITQEIIDRSVESAIQRLVPEIVASLKDTLKVQPLTLEPLKVEGKVKKNLKVKGGLKGQTGFLSEGVKDTLIQANVDPDLIRFYDAWNGYANALNNPRSGNPQDSVRIAKAMTLKDGFKARFESWVKNHPAPAPDYRSRYARLIMEKEADLLGFFKTRHLRTK